MTTDKPLTDYEQKIIDYVESDGCFVTGVFDPDHREPSFSYSVGFPKSVGQGEVIVFGLSHSLMHQMINAIWKSCSQGAVLADGLQMSGILEGFRIIVRKIVPEKIIPEFFNSAIWFHRRSFERELIDAYQIVWPGAQQGLFPWEAGCDEYVIAQQPALYQLSTH